MGGEPVFNDSAVDRLNVMKHNRLCNGRHGESLLLLLVHKSSRRRVDEIVELASKASSD